MKGRTLMDVAQAAGLSRAGASYALRGDPSIPAETTARVRKIAASLGYRPDIRISSLMAHISRSRALHRRRETIAFVWVSTPNRSGKLPTHPRYYATAVFDGAKRRAEELGCVLSPFRLDEPGMSPRRLSEIFRARGITGIIFSPSALDLVVRIDLDWSLFACAIIGNTEWVPVLNRAGHNHYRSMWLTLELLRSRGFHRPAAILNRNAHERTHGMHFAAFLANHPLPDQAAAWVQFSPTGKLSELVRWPSRQGPDALILGWQVDRPSLPALQRLAPGARQIVTLDWRSGSPVAGMDACHETIAASAVDLVVAQLHRNERGVPGHPATLLIEGVWRDSAVALAAAEPAR